MGIATCIINSYDVQKVFFMHHRALFTLLYKASTMVSRTRDMLSENMKLIRLGPST